MVPQDMFPPPTHQGLGGWQFFLNPPHRSEPQGEPSYMDYTKNYVHLEGVFT